MRIGIFGGSFNPPHLMHKNIALNLINNDYLDKVIYVPTGDKYQKSNLISAKDRIEMIKLMISDCNNLDVSDYEVKNVLTYTYQTLDYFKSLYPDSEIYFICGTDNLKEIMTWKNYEYMLDNYKFIVINRNGDDIQNILQLINNKNIIIANIPRYDLSSTEIRCDLQDHKKREKIKYVDKKVLEYIKNKKLYE